LALRELLRQRLVGGGWWARARRELLRQRLGGEGWWARVHRERLARPLVGGEWSGRVLPGVGRLKPWVSVLKSVRPRWREVQSWVDLPRRWRLESRRASVARLAWAGQSEWKVLEWVECFRSYALVGVMFGQVGKAALGCQTPSLRCRVFFGVIFPASWFLSGSRHVRR